MWAEVILVLSSFRDVSHVHFPQGGLELVKPGMISNKKYDAELLSAVTLEALTVQGIPEAYKWLEMAVEQSDIPMGAAVESMAAPGALGPLHECGAGRRVAHVQLILPSEDRHDPNLFWALPAGAQAQPSVHLNAHPLANVRYTNPAQVPSHMLPDPSSDDEVEAPVAVGRKRKRAKSAQPKPKAKQKKARQVKAKQNKAEQKNFKAEQKKAEKKKAEQTIDFSSLRAGTYVLTNDQFPAGPGFSVSQVVSDNQGTEDDGAWRYKHLLPSVDPWKKSIVSAKFGVGRGRIVDGGTDVIHSYSIITTWRGGLNATGKLPAKIQNIVKEHKDWLAL
jgi:hypothetical protein